MKQEKIEYLPIALVVATLQVRRAFSEGPLEDLKETLMSLGQLAPVRVRREGDLYVLVDGERRYRAAKLAGMTTIAAIIDEEELSPAAIRQRQLVANGQHEALAPLEIATAIKEQMQETGATAGEVAAQIGKSEGTVSRLLAMLDLPTAIQQKVADGSISPSAAYQLTKVEDATEQESLAAQIANGQLNRDGISGIVKNKSNGRKEAGSEQPGRIKAELSNGRSITVAGVGLDSLDLLIEWLLELVAKARKQRPKGLALGTFSQLLRDEAKA